MKELVLISGLGVLALAAGLLNLRKLFMPIVLLGLITLIGLCAYDWNANEHVYNMLLLDHYALAFTGVFSFIAILWFISAYDYFTDDNNFSDHFALVLFTLTGGFLLVSYTNMVMLFLGIEILSIPLFVLVGSNKTSLASNEAAFKYFLLGSFASAFMLFGMALLYGTTGSFYNAQISAAILGNSGVNPMVFAGMLLMLMAMAFKVSAAPFHFWAPDVYQGAPTNITAFMATVVKTVAFAGFFRLFQTTFAALQGQYTTILSVICTVTLLLANITAAVQTNVKRMLSYSSISHAGFMLVAVLTVTGNTAGILLYYTVVYSISSIIAFTVLRYVQAHNAHNDETIQAFTALVKRNPMMAGSMILALLSMSGIPPLSGFLAKYFIFTAAVQNGFVWLVVIAIIASLIGVYYYFKVIIAMFGKSGDQTPFTIPLSQKLLLMVCSLALIALSVVPDLILNLLQN